MERTGWRAIIYDAPWARFKDGQEGVFVSEDGRTCETIDDDRSNIVVEADENSNPSEPRTGHILFRQKGSDLFDIVCLYQEAAGVYLLTVNPVTIDGCVGKRYDELRDSLIVYEKINNNPQKRVTDFTLVSPTEQQAQESDNFKLLAGTTIPIVVSKGGKTAESTLTITSQYETNEVYQNTIIDGFVESNFEFTKEDDGSHSMCTVIFYKKETPIEHIGNTPVFGCSGGTIEISINKTESKDPEYKILIGDITVTHIYKIYKCGEEISPSVMHPGTATISVVEEEGIKVLSGGNPIKLTIAESVTAITLKITPNLGEEKTLLLTVPN